VFNAAVNVLRGMPYLIFIEILFIFLPIMFHGIYGVIIYLGSKSNLREYNLFQNWMYVIQRISGVYTLIFIAVHLWTLRIASIINPEMHVNFELMARQLASPGMLWFYILGVLAAVYHLSNGIWNFCITWGITIGPKSQRMCAYVCAAMGLALSFMGVNALLAFIGKGLILSI
jgi:succinate dehydrogenase / fumarate reductase cytochrome b subunit